MNVDDAVAFLESHTTKTSGERCAFAVRRALEAGGTVINPHPRDAKDYGAYLELNGFASVDQAKYKAAKGDVVVIQPYQGGNPAGHIAMYDGTQWVSDFWQSDMWGGPGYRTNKPAYVVYRP